MNQRTRYFLVASSLIVVVGLGVGLVAVYSGGLQSGRSTGPAGLAYVTSEATAVAYADVRHIMDSEFRQRLRTVLPSGEGKDRLLAETGIDVERDIDTVLAGLSSDIMAAGGPVVILRGRFNTSRIEEAALRHGATAEEYKGRRLLETLGRSVEPSGDPAQPPAAESAAREHPAIAFLEPGLIALGRLDAVKRAIDAADRGESVTANTELMQFIGDMSDAGDAWIAGRLDTASGESAWPDAMKTHLSAVEWFSLSAGIGPTVTCRLRAEARDAQSAEQLRSVVNGALAMAKMMAAKDARLAGMLDSVQSSGTGAEMELSFTVPPDVLDLMTSAAPAQ